MEGSQASLDIPSAKGVELAVKVINDDGGKVERPSKIVNGTGLEPCATIII